MRGETLYNHFMRSRAGNFNPLPSCEGRHADKLHEELARLFQSTPLMRGETIELMESDGMTLISIHFPHARGDGNRLWIARTTSYFNPLPSCEGRPAARQYSVCAGSISIHSPLTRGDQAREAKIIWRLYFNPLPSHEGRREENNLIPKPWRISIRSPHTRGDWLSLFQLFAPVYFNPLPSYEGRRHAGDGLRRLVAISIRSPHTRGDSISLQKSIRIYVSLHNKTMIHRFSRLYKPLFAAQSPIFGVRSP